MKNLRNYDVDLIKTDGLPSLNNKNDFFYLII